MNIPAAVKNDRFVWKPGDLKLLPIELSEAILLGNTHRYPAGTSKGGQFAPKGRAGGVSAPSASHAGTVSGVGVGDKAFLKSKAGGFDIAHMPTFPSTGDRFAIVGPSGNWITAPTQNAIIKRAQKRAGWKGDYGEEIHVLDFTGSSNSTPSRMFRVNVNGEIMGSGLPWNPSSTSVTVPKPKPPSVPPITPPKLNADPVKHPTGAEIRSKLSEHGKQLDAMLRRHNEERANINYTTSDFWAVSGELAKRQSLEMETLNAKTMEILKASNPSKVTKTLPDYRNHVKSEVVQKGAIPKRADEGIALFNSLVEDIGIRQVPVYRTTDGRAFHHQGAISIDAHSPKSIVVHELGHVIEYTHQESRRAALIFRSRRTEGEELQGVHGKNDKEVCKPDKFFDRYCGRFYPGSPSTEIISMGLQRMVEDPHGFAKNDPDYFDFVWSVMKGKPEPGALPPRPHNPDVKKKRTFNLNLPKR